jgi:hypothetical protein
MQRIWFQPPQALPTLPSIVVAGVLPQTLSWLRQTEKTGKTAAAPMVKKQALGCQRVVVDCIAMVVVIFVAAAFPLHPVHLAVSIPPHHPLFKG